MVFLEKNKELLGALLQSTAILVGSLGVYAQISSSNASGQLATATDLYDTYLEFAFDNPKYAENFDYLGPRVSKEENVKYTWYVSRLLFVSEEILKLSLDNENKREWCETIFSQLEYHEKYLTSHDFSSHRGHYTSEITEMFDYFKLIEPKAKFDCHP
ncbi:hypothetical protein [Vibrio coralliilyticus]|uniref:hypothetical protein n=1 Tax=Vibrio coralliilyticus TaxID=190893 RepID=UPI00148C2EE9|nr:hypothetical protein [Vibrio coralliilyticus]NOI27764.1 hypothetical protein [Vibrio coralliilyticus]NOI47116.1 hypothetical protein [Vibrio coralliilyticus]